MAQLKEDKYYTVVGWGAGPRYLTGGSIDTADEANRIANHLLINAKNMHKGRGAKPWVAVVKVEEICR